METNTTGTLRERALAAYEASVRQRQEEEANRERVFRERALVRFSETLASIGVACMPDDFTVTIDGMTIEWESPWALRFKALKPCFVCGAELITRVLLDMEPEARLVRIGAALTGADHASKCPAPLRERE